jgi:hypothetical protein
MHGAAEASRGMATALAAAPRCVSFGDAVLTNEQHDD